MALAWKPISELLKKHISVFEDFDKNGCRREQLDFLSCRVKKDGFEKANPFNLRQTRDNPNREPTKYENVYQLIDEDKIILQYVRDWFTPVAILQWFKIKTPSVEDWKISIYGKWLRLYYCGFLDWLPDYINTYCWEVVRADLCRDHKEKINPAVVDLPCSITIWEWENWTYKWFWNKRSPLFIRIYDKTLDLKKDHNCMSWLYPARYTDCCRRIEAKLTWIYAKSMSALEWLWIVDRVWTIWETTRTKRNYLKSAFYNLIMYLDFIPNRSLQYEILESVRIMCTKKIKKLKDEIKIDDD